jgi:S1-C subfamily serine protease
MSIRDGLEPSRSPDSDTQTQPLPRDPRPEAAPAQPAGAPEAPQPLPPAASQPGPADEAWPPSWGEAPSSQGQAPSSQGQAPPSQGASPAPAEAPTWTETPAWTQPKAAQGPSWTQTTPTQTTPTQTTPPAQPGHPEPRPDQPQADWGQGGSGGGGYPTAPAWGSRPADAGAPRGRPSRWVAGAVAGVVLLAAGFGISQAIDNDATPAGVGIPTAAPASATPVPSASGQEPAAVVAKALLPTVVEIRHDNGVGSGFVYDSNGYIMTAAHVIDGVDQVEVRLYDGTELQGKVVGTDDLNDVGVVKVDRTGLKAAPLGIGQDLQVGQLAIAIGSPFGLNETVTAGIISSTDRLLEGREVIQTDAPINPGNSGGVLADRQGRVIGINSAIRPGDNSNGNVGIGFAVPIDIAAKSATAIVKGEQIQIGYLGVRASATTGGTDGALIQEVTPDSPASKARIQPGDVVVSVDGKAIQNDSEMIAAIRAHQPGDKVTIGVVRGGNETTITATLTERPAG